MQIAAEFQLGITNNINIKKLNHPGGTEKGENIASE